MNRFVHRPHKIFPHLIVAIAYILYVTVFAVYHEYAQVGLSSLAVIPVIAGGWYFGISGGIFVTILSILPSVILLIIAGQPQDVSLFSLVSGAKQPKGANAKAKRSVLHRINFARFHLNVLSCTLTIE